MGFVTLRLLDNTDFFLKELSFNFQALGDRKISQKAHIGACLKEQITGESRGKLGYE